MSNIYVLGSVNMDLVITTPYMPISGETLSGKDFFLNPGGKGANQAVAASKMNVKTFLIGNVGNDIFGESLLKTLRSYNVDTTYTKAIASSSGVAMIVICNNDNRIILDGGANIKIENTQIDEALSKATENDIFITQLENNLDAVIYGLKKASSKNMITIFNPAPAIKLDNDIYQYVTYLIVNESECEILTNINPTDENSAKEAYKYLNNLGVKKLIITLGSNGSICFDNDTIYKIKANKIKPVDTTAAGDTFVGALASRLSLNESLEDSLNFASIVSSLTCLKKGAQQAIPTLDEVNEYLKSK